MINHCGGDCWQRPRLDGFCMLIVDAQKSREAPQPAPQPAAQPAPSYALDSAAADLSLGIPCAHDKIMNVTDKIAAKIPKNVSKVLLPRFPKPFPSIKTLNSLAMFSLQYVFCVIVCFFWKGKQGRRTYI
ncbi:hypothetical protein HAX54_013411 [Datura stramonium]|uniref:Uncharacterized protein n=1 Tax=Datura stramonium TaxID=4076 RepID=A0ABS8RYF1_DATST|nr:hypothetical protein [Datura stramonium]